jgi:hypothetical protein
MKTWLCLFVLAVILIMPGASFCQQEGSAETHSRQGIVSEVDSIGSLLILFDGSEQLRFYVEPGASIQRGTDDIMLADLESNDTVTVEYYKAPNGQLKAVSIVDNNIASDF